MTKEEEMFHESLRATCDDLFQTIGLTVLAALGRDKSCELDNNQLASMIGFLGPRIKGSLSLRAPISFFAATFPMANKLGSRSLHEVSDWAAELTNQLLGRLKNKLLPYGVSLSVSTPATLFGSFLREPVSRGRAVTLVFPWHEDDIFVRCAVELEPGFRFLDAPTNASVEIESGEPLLF